MKQCYLKSTLAILLSIWYAIGISQNPMSFYQDNFHGGVTGNGWSPKDYSFGTGNFSVSIPAGSTIRTAYLFAGRVALAYNIQVELNGDTLTFDPSTVATPTFTSFVYGTGCAVCAINVTQLISPSTQQYSLTVPLQTGVNARYQDFYLYIAYDNPSLPVVNTAVFMNTQDITDTISFSSMVLTNPYVQPGDFGVAMFAGYLCDTANDGEYIYLDSTYIGFIGTPISSQQGCVETKGSFYYYSDSLHGLDGDTTLLLMSDSDALSNAASIIANNADSLNMTFIHQPALNERPDNNIWAVILAYSGVLGTGINNVPLQNQAQIFPNPFIDNLHINFNSSASNTSNRYAQIIDVVGNIIYTGALPGSNNIINLAGQPAGIYFIKITSALSSETFKVIKEK